jgi:DNA invertase Pin-like site-specific DNA recombinase
VKNTPTILTTTAAQPIRAAIYARYSSDRQKMTSIDDQIAMTSSYCEAQRWTIVGAYTDIAKSGRSIRRDGVQALLQAIEAGQADVVVVEAVDRLTCHIADGLNTLDLFRHRSIKLFSVTEGEQDFLAMLITATGAQLAAQNIGVHTQPALREGIKRGRLVTRAYGYRALDRAEGLNRAIHPEEAAVVRRIFEAFAEGRAPDAIACDLNAEGVPSPGGGTWHGSTIRGNADRGEGILRNRLYRGTATIGRTEKSYHPETGSKRVKPTQTARSRSTSPNCASCPSRCGSPSKPSWIAAPFRSTVSATRSRHGARVTCWRAC